MMETTILLTIIAIPGILFLLPLQYKFAFSLLLHLLTGAATLAIAVQVLAGGSPFMAEIPLHTWSGDISLTVDKLSAFFILLINLGTLAGIFYAGPYLRPYQARKSGFQFSVHYFSLFWLHASMLLTTMAGDGMFFLISWELMSVSSFFLVIFLGSDKQVIKAGVKYLIQMHIGFLFLLSAMMLTGIRSGLWSFEGLAFVFEHGENKWILILFLAGFAFKAGWMPFHSWLPDAHPVAPSHVSGIMSGVMLKLGIYGMLRVLTYVQEGFFETGIMILSIGGVTALYGILLSAFQRDIKRVLAYSSIENMGIIGMGIGLALLGRAWNNPAIMIAGMGGALFHMFNHVLFKSLLFQTAGNVYYSTHTRDLEKLGGLSRIMPVSTAMFMAGSIAISGIPPLNGFISEFLIYKGSLNIMSSGGFGPAVIALAAMLTLVVVGGMAIFSFSRVFGLGFLGHNRGNIRHFRPLPRAMTWPGLVLLAIMLMAGIFPNLFFSVISDVIASFPGFENAAASYSTLPGELHKISIAGVAMLILTAVILGLRSLQHKKTVISKGPTWGCGYAAVSAKHQYTGSSWTDHLGQLLSPLTRYRVKSGSIEENDTFPVPGQLKTDAEDLIDKQVLFHPVQKILQLLPKAGRAQTGKVQHYLIYPLLFLLLIGILTMFNLL